MSDLQQREQAVRQALDIVVRLLQIEPSEVGRFKAAMLDEWYRQHGRMHVAERVRHESH
jgi:hypothetical protein